MPPPPSRRQLAGMIDHSVLAPQASLDELREGARIARQYAVKSLCVKPCHVAAAAELLAGSGVLVGATVSFPHGADTPEVKAFQARTASDNGAGEVDMVLNIGALVAGDLDYVRRDIAAVVASAGGRCVKVILECALLTDAQKASACQAATSAGASFVKTSTGFGPSGATVADVRLLRASAGAGVGVKAAGGIRTLEQALALIEAGASRLGTSATAAILEALPDDPS